MILTKTPFRISFFGGGTDYPSWYKNRGGSVISVTINKYCYLTCRYLPPFFDYKYRIRYYQREEAQTVEQIQHPAVRNCLKYVGNNQGIDLVHHADLPARSGLGSSSTFTVGLLHALYALQHRLITKRQLALDAIKVEQELIKEVVGSQDQTAAAFGGLNRINFGGASEIIVNPLIINPNRYENLEKHLMLFFTGFSRTASEIASDQMGQMPKNSKRLEEMGQIVDEAESLLFQNTEKSLIDFGELLHTQWLLKKEMSDTVSNNQIDKIYEAGINAGATGGKLLGAGGGGFMLFFVKPELQGNVRKALQSLLYVPFRFDSYGSQVIYHSDQLEY